MKLKKLLTRPRLIVLLIFIILATVTIYPNPGNEGAAIRTVDQNSSAARIGIENPKPTGTPMSREVIQAINNIPVTSAQEYFNVLEQVPPNTTLNILTSKGVYNIPIESPEELGLSVYDAPKSNIRKGLDLQGGTRVLLQPAEKLEAEDMSILIESMKQRLNVYGLSDLIIRDAEDLPPPIGSGNQFVVVEIAGATKEEVQDLLAQQGKFDAKIGNATAIRGDTDVKSVCRSADCSGIDPHRGCGTASGSPHGGAGDQWVCGFRFSITLSQESADKLADLTRELPVSSENPEYLQEPLGLYLDNTQVDQLNIVSDLRGRAVTEIQISGSGVGYSRQEAALVALQDMKELQTLLITGSLPVEIEIVKVDSTSPQLGQEFIRNAMLVGMLAMLVVAGVIFVRYRQLKISLTMIFIMLSEIVLLLGVAALIGWNLDLAAIAGIIIAVGTGVDDQIVITDETLRGQKKNEIYNWKKRLKRALFIIMAAYFTTVVAMIPLVFAGAGLLKGFAITTIIGVSIGVFITRPTYASIIEILVKE